MNKRLLVGIVIFFGAANIAFAGPNYSYKQSQSQFPQNNTLQGSVVKVPAGTSLRAVVTTPLSSEFAYNGQNVSAALCEDFYYNGKLIAPSGSQVNGTVIESSKAKIGSFNGKLNIRFTEIITPFGTVIPILGAIKTDNGTGILTGGTGIDTIQSYAKDIAVGSATGALSGLVFGALSGGNIGRGTALGTAVGATGGLTKSVIDKGCDVEIPSNAVIDLVLVQSVTVNSTLYLNEN